MYSTLANVKNVLCKYQNCFCRGLLVKPHWWLFYRREPKDYVKFSGTSSITRRMKALSIKWWRTALHRLVSDFPKKKNQNWLILPRIPRMPLNSFVGPFVCGEGGFDRSCQNKVTGNGREVFPARRDATKSRRKGQSRWANSFLCTCLCMG